MHLIIGRFAGCLVAGLAAVGYAQGGGTTTDHAPIASALAKQVHRAGFSSSSSTTPAAAARLLEQASFGPSAVSIAHVEQVGLPAYLAEQFEQAPTMLEVSLPVNVSKDALPAYCLRSAHKCVDFAWWSNAMTGQDQLRQRVAFALSQVFVISQDTVWSDAFPGYMNLLAEDAFGNWSTLMHDAALSPGMGVYLNMINSGKASPGQIPNENFAREFMQLFTIGPSRLQMDGTPVLDGSGRPLPNYSEQQVEAFARAYTGWTSALPDGGKPTRMVSGSHFVYTAPMAALERAHDTSEKLLLRGEVSLAGQSAEEDLDEAIQNIFNDPSSPPFVSKLLIQHLVTSNPSPEFVSRVAQAFVDDGSGVRGNMVAVLTAIFLDPEARAGDDGVPAASFGHLREPILWLTGVMRGLDAAPSVGNASAYGQLDAFASTLGQPVLDAPSVFNFYPSTQDLPGSALLAPEFALETTASVIAKLNIADAIVQNKIGSEAVDLSATSPLARLAAAGPTQLVDQLNLVFLHGGMSADMRSTILQAIQGVPAPAQQVRIAVYLVITSTAYKVAS